MDDPQPDTRGPRAARALRSADEERRLLERELHDGVQQQLVALAVELQLAQRLHVDDPAGGAEAIAQARQSLLQTIDDLRRLADLLYPSLLEDQGLAAALGAVATRSRSRAHLDLRVDPQAPREIVLTIYLCCARLLEQADCSSVRLTAGDGVLQFEAVATDGDAAEPLVEPMRDRLEAEGGTLSVEREEPGLVRFTGTLPA